MIMPSTSNIFFFIICLLFVRKFYLILIHIVCLPKETFQYRLSIAPGIVIESIFNRIRFSLFYQLIQRLAIFFQGDLAENTLIFMIQLERICIQFTA